MLFYSPYYSKFKSIENLTHNPLKTNRLIIELLISMFTVITLSEINILESTKLFDWHLDMIEILELNLAIAHVIS